MSVNDDTAAAFRALAAAQFKYLLSPEGQLYMERFNEPVMVKLAWPQRIIDHLGREPQVGDWFSECCEVDLYQVDADDLAVLLEEYSDFDSGGNFWINKASALRDLPDIESRHPRKKLSHFYGFLWEVPRGGIRSLVLLPRIRLATGSAVGLGFSWLTAWLHVWLWGQNRPTKSHGRLIEVLPYVWIHWHREYGAGVHLQWILWRAHFWFWRKES